MTTRRGDRGWHRDLPFELGDIVEHLMTNEEGVITYIDWDDPIMTYRVKWFYDDEPESEFDRGTWVNNRYLRMAEAEIPL